MNSSGTKINKEKGEAVYLLMSRHPDIKRPASTYTMVGKEYI